MSISRQIAVGDINTLGDALQAKSGAAASVTGTASETALATITVPGGTIGANGEIAVRAFFTTTNSANNKTLRVRLGGLSGSICGTLTLTTIGGTVMTTWIRNKNATGSQYVFATGSRGSDGLISGAISSPTSVDTTASQDLVISGQLANTGETITLEGYTVEYLK